MNVLIIEDGTRTARPWPDIKTAKQTAGNSCIISGLQLHFLYGNPMLRPSGATVVRTTKRIYYSDRINNTLFALDTTHNVKVKKKKTKPLCRQKANGIK